MQNNGFIYAKVFGGFAQIRSSVMIYQMHTKFVSSYYLVYKSSENVLILQIPDLVAISRLLNATLVIPEIQESSGSKGIRYVP